MQRYSVLNMIFETKNQQMPKYKQFICIHKAAYPVVSKEQQKTVQVPKAIGNSSLCVDVAFYCHKCWLRTALKTLGTPHKKVIRTFCMLSASKCDCRQNSWKLRGLLLTALHSGIMVHVLPPRFLQDHSACRQVYIKKTEWEKISN